MTRSSSLHAHEGKSNGDDYSPSDNPADASVGDSLDDDLASDAFGAPASAGVGGNAPRTVEVPPALAGERLDKALAQLFPEFSRSRLQQWIESSRVRIDGAPAKIRQPVPLGATIELIPDLLPEQLAFAPEPVPLAIVYEDDTLVVIDKPAGLVVHPAAGNWGGTLLNGLLHRYGDAAAGLPRAGIVHRLDKETSGLMVVARTLAAQTDLVRQLQARTVKRRYFALAWGRMPDEGTIDAPIGRDPRERTRMAVVTGAAGKPARTHFRTIDTALWERQPVSAIHCDLETGRTHQIRVHCAHAGHPLLGDPVYGRARGKRSVAALPGGFARQALHAWRLGLVHPATGRAMHWRAPLPDDLAALVDALGFGADDGEFGDDGAVYDDGYDDGIPYADDDEDWLPMTPPRPLTLADCVQPDWGAPPRVRALVSTRNGGVSAPPYGGWRDACEVTGGMNLGFHTGDDPAHVAANRARLLALTGQPRAAWLEQVHGTDVVRADEALAGATDGSARVVRADASVTVTPGAVCVVMVADCLPVLLCDGAGRAVGAAHAGWRGLAAGIVEKTAERVAQLAGCDADGLFAYLGPAIGPAAFEVGADVRAAFLAAAQLADYAATDRAFVPQAAAPGKYRADLYALARLRLARAGVMRVSGGGACTLSERERFYSYRRDRVTGRMAAMIWLTE